MNQKRVVRKWNLIFKTAWAVWRLRHGYFANWADLCSLGDPIQRKIIKRRNEEKKDKRERGIKKEEGSVGLRLCFAWKDVSKHLFNANRSLTKCERKDSIDV